MLGTLKIAKNLLFLHAVKSYNMGSPDVLLIFIALKHPSPLLCLNLRTLDPVAGTLIITPLRQLSTDT
jgi:hypothetical protein